MVHDDSGDLQAVEMLGLTAEGLSTRTAPVALCTSGRQGCICALRRIAPDRALDEPFARNFDSRVPALPNALSESVQLQGRDQ